MPKNFRYLLCGLGIWGIPFVVGMAIFNFVPPTNELFESIMAVSMGLSAAWLSWLHMRRLEQPSWSKGLIEGLGWAGIAVALDLPFVFSVFGMSPGEYVEDIAVSYLIVPAIASAMGRALQRED
jgi:hypothetical protein